MGLHQIFYNYILWLSVQYFHGTPECVNEGGLSIYCLILGLFSFCWVAWSSFNMFLFYFIIFILFLKYFRDYIIITLMEGTALVVMLLELIQTYQSTWSHGTDGLISSNYCNIHEYEGVGSISENKKGSRGYDLRQNKVISDREMSSVFGHNRWGSCPVCFKKSEKYLVMPFSPHREILKKSGVLPWYEYCIVYSYMEIYGTYITFYVLIKSFKMKIDMGKSYRRRRGRRRRWRRKEGREGGM